jgi:hypothetical protein
MCLPLAPKYIVSGFALIIGLLLTLTLVPYRGNITALFHLDVPTVEQGHLPHPFVVLDVPGYDGMHYFRIAQHIPQLFSVEGRAAIGESRTVAYAYQRFGLPLFSFMLSFGIPSLLPWAFLFIQLASLIGLVWILCKYDIPPLYALAIGLSPAALVGLHFSLAEPLTLLLVTSALLLYTSRSTIGFEEVALLSFLTIVREINVLLAGFMLLFALLKRDHTRTYLLLIPLLVFAAWHGAIYSIFHQMPFFWSTDKHALPFTAIFDIIVHPKGYNALTLSAMALFALFVVPMFVLFLRDLFRDKLRADVLVVGSLFFLSIMSLMPDHIWGSMTSIGRVITPVYPFTMLALARKNTPAAKVLAACVIVLGLAIGIALALLPHPFHLV